MLITRPSSSTSGRRITKLPPEYARITAPESFGGRSGGAAGAVLTGRSFPIGGGDHRPRRMAGVIVGGIITQRACVIAR